MTRLVQVPLFALLSRPRRATVAVVAMAKQTVGADAPFVVLPAADFARTLQTTTYFPYSSRKREH